MCSGKKNKAIGVDFYNLDITGKVAKTHTAGRNDKNHIPCVVTFEPGIASRDGGHVYEGVSGTLRATPGDNQMTVAFTTEMTPKVDTKGKAFSLRERDYKDPQAIVIENHPNDSRVKIDDSGTLRATPGDNQMTVAYDIGEARLRNPQEYIEKSPTITARCGTGGNNVPAVVFENHSQDSRYKGPLKVAQPVTATYGMGGNNQPLVICLQGNGIDRADTAGCNGKGWTEDVSYTLNTIDRHAVACCMETFHCNTEEEKPHPSKREIIKIL